MFLKWYTNLFETLEQTKRAVMVDLQNTSDRELGRLWATPGSAEEVTAEVYRRQEARLRAYDYYGSPQHLEDIRRERLEATHADVTPPWEE